MSQVPRWILQVDNDPRLVGVIRIITCAGVEGALLGFGHYYSLR